MRVVLDLQGAQGGSRFRGIGRYSIDLARAMIINHPQHEFLIVLNGLLDQSVENIRGEFEGVLAQERILTWTAAGPLVPSAGHNQGRRAAAEIIRETFIASLNPDVVHISSLFEGFLDDAISSIGRSHWRLPTAVTFYDLIPLIESDRYLPPGSSYEAFYREKLAYLRKADRYLAISASAGSELVEHLQVDPQRIINIGAAIDPKFKQIDVPQKLASDVLDRFKLGPRFLLYSGATDERKNHLRLIEAFSKIAPAHKVDLCIAGRLPDDHRATFQAHAAKFGIDPSRLVFTGHVTDAELLALYNLCTLFVFPSWHEGFGLPALEAMACGAPVIASNTTSLPEVVGLEEALFDPFDAGAIAAKIDHALSDETFRRRLIENGRTQAAKFSWKRSAEIAVQAMEALHEREARDSASRLDAGQYQSWLAQTLGRSAALATSEQDLVATAAAIAQNHPRQDRRQLFVDISELVHRDHRTGIQRVVRSVLAELLGSERSTFDIQLVYATAHEDGYRYARRFGAAYRGRSPEGQFDDRIEIRAGDVFLGLDLNHHVVIRQEATFARMRDVGVALYFVIYDLLPISMPEHFPDGTSAFHEAWLTTIASVADGALCISRAVADEMHTWLETRCPSRSRAFAVDWFHLGADVARSVPTKGLPPDADRILRALESRRSFLMVGTVEPRKGHAQTLAGFEKLWAAGVDVNLVIVGKYGWNMDELAARMRRHPEFGHRLIWLEGISDEFLELAYQKSDCLIAASEGEGFGLPIIEAGQHGIPIMARDIPVFREVAGDSAVYFSGADGDAVTRAVKRWIELDAAGSVPDTRGMRWLTWKQSTEAILACLSGERVYKRFRVHGFSQFFTATDPRFGTQAGKRVGTSIQTLGQDGFLIYGPYMALAPGAYQILVRAEAEPCNYQGCVIDVTARGSSLELFRGPLDALFQSGSILLAPVKVPSAVGDLEIRIWVTAAARLKLNSIAIREYVEVLPSATAESAVAA